MKRGWLYAVAVSCVVVFLAGCGGDGTGNGDGGGAVFGSGELLDAQGIALDADGNVYVSDLGHNEIRKYSSVGEFIGKWDFEPGSKPYGLVVHDERLYVCDTFSQVQVFDLNGEHQDTWTVPDSNDRSGGMGVVDIDVDGSGVFYVLDNIDRSVKKFNASGTFLGSFQVDVQDTGDWGPACIVVHGNNVYITDTINNNILVFTRTGTFVELWGTLGSGNGQFFNCEGLALMGGDSLIVGDMNLSPVFGRLQKFDLTGNYEDTIQPNSGSFNARALAVNDELGLIYILESNRVRMVDVF